MKEPIARGPCGVTEVKDSGQGASSGGKNSRIVVLSGPSGSGKSTIVNRLVERAPVRLVKAISATTRAPRAGETEGQDYYVRTPPEFERRRRIVFRR